MSAALTAVLCCLALAACAPISGHRIDAYSPYLDDDYDVFSSVLGPPSDPFWRQFWDTYNYRGPLQEEVAFPPPNYPRPVRDSFRPDDARREDEYHRYRNYFYRRFGMNTLD